MSAGVVVDTDVVSYLYKGDTRASAYAKHLAGTRPHVAFATVAELYRWGVRHGWGQQRINKLSATIGKYTVLHSDEPTAMEWARVMSLKGRPMGQGDAWVAAVAIRHGMPLVTHNRKHFEGIPGLTVISES
jgi:predicted nucleic acid-binding protein